MKKNVSAMKLLTLSAVLLAWIFSFAGCADYASVGVGYGDAYYAPDYRPFYAAYYYDGVPYWGPNYSYVRKKVVVRDVDKHVNVNRNVYYGGHHFVRDRQGPRRITPAGTFRRGRR
jgi:hypothetical protein